MTPSAQFLVNVGGRRNKNDGDSAYQNVTRNADITFDKHIYYYNQMSGGGGIFFKPLCILP